MGLEINGFNTQICEYLHGLASRLHNIWNDNLNCSMTKSYSRTARRWKCFFRMCDSKIFSCFAAEMKIDEEQEHFKCEKMIQSPHRELYHNHNISVCLQKYWVYHPAFATASSFLNTKSKLGLNDSLNKHICVKTVICSNEVYYN